MNNSNLFPGINGHNEPITDDSSFNSFFTTNYTEPSRPIRLSPANPIYLPFEKSKPCVSLKMKIEDMRHIMFKINFIKNNLIELVSLPV